MPSRPRVPKLLKRATQELVSKPATTKYPFVKPTLPQDFRGQPIFDCSLCIGCGMCSRECPSKAITMVEVDKKKKPEIRLDKCIFCYHCVDICPKKAIKHSDQYELAVTDKSTLTIKPDFDQKSSTPS